MFFISSLMLLISGIALDVKDDRNIWSITQLERGKCFIGARAFYCLIQITESKSCGGAAACGACARLCVYIIYTFYTLTNLLGAERNKDQRRDAKGWFLLYQKGSAPRAQQRRLAQRRRRRIWGPRMESRKGVFCVSRAGVCGKKSDLALFIALARLI